MKQHVNILPLADDAPIPYDLLLLADETKEIIDSYIYDCSIFMLTKETNISLDPLKNQVGCLDHNSPITDKNKSSLDEKSIVAIGVMAIMKLDTDTLELKNMAIAPHEQSQGFGSDMLSYLKSYARDHHFQKIWVGTADVGYRQHQFYMRNEFEMDHIRKNFFLNNYPVPLIENGLQMKHMLVFQYQL